MSFDLTIEVAAILLTGVVIGMILMYAIILKVWKVGKMVIDDADEAVEKYSLEVDVPINKLSENRYVMFKVIDSGRSK